MKKAVLTTIAIFTSVYFYAQDSGENKLGAWYMYFGTNKISEKWSLHTEAQFRYFEVTQNFNQMLLRTGLNYHIDDKAIATLGYGFIETDGTFVENDGNPNSSEHRIFQQFILKNKVGVFNFEHRYRIEERFLYHRGENDFQSRGRYRLQITLPVSKTFFLNVYDEIFLNFQDDIFGQNRLYGALGFKLAPNASVQVGYLKNHFSNAHYDRLQLGMFYNMDWSKKENVQNL